MQFEIKESEIVSAARRQVLDFCEKEVGEHLKTIFSEEVPATETTPAIPAGRARILLESIVNSALEQGQMRKQLDQLIDTIFTNHLPHLVRPVVQVKLQQYDIPSMVDSYLAENLSSQLETILVDALGGHLNQEVKARLDQVVDALTKA